jgi:hypothetical protein
MVNLYGGVPVAEHVVAHGTLTIAGPLVFVQLKFTLAATPIVNVGTDLGGPPLALLSFTVTVTG